MSRYRADEPRFVRGGRDSFARFSLVYLPTKERSSCAWCGSGSAPRRPLKFYGAWSDDKPRPYVDESRAFCSRSCWSSFHA